jgi:hypothetical protein
MRKALLDMSISSGKRSANMHAHGDRLRSAIIELRQSLGIGAVLAFARQLQGPQARPALGADKAASLAAIEAVEAELKRIGAEIEKQALQTGKAMQIDQLEVYTPSSDVALVLRHWTSNLPVLGASIALDLSILMIFAIFCVAHDYAREPEETNGPCQTDIARPGA